MKKSSLLLLTSLMSSAVYADYNQNGYGQQQTVKECVTKKEIREGVVASEGVAAKAAKPDEPLSKCEQLMLISAVNGGNEYSQTESFRTADGKASCMARGGYTLDYDDCKRVGIAYNAVVIAEQAMFATQKIRVNESNIASQKKVAEAQAKGDLQNASLEAIKDQNERNKKLYQEQFWTYNTAVTALGTTIATWQGKGEKAAERFCKKEQNLSRGKKVAVDELGLKDKDFDAAICAKLIQSNKGAVFTNGDAKGMFIILGSQYVTKAAEAYAMMKRSGEIADALPDTVATDGDVDAMFEKCVLPEYANTPECKGRGGRTNTGSSFQGSSIDFGAGANGQAFNFGPEGDNSLNPDTTVGATDTEVVGDHSSPFESEAKAASGILDPASKANVSAGSPSSGGGGAAGGGGGGGGGNLGDDLEGAGADENKEPEIVAGKVNGKYGSGGGGGFQGVKGGKDENGNPFSSLFDSKSEGGGIEEDRSIASGDIDGAASGLFQKISKRYGQVQQDKRLDQQNLE